MHTTHKKIEVELRGVLTDEEYESMRAYLAEHGEHMGGHEREMYLLRDYPGYAKDFIDRSVDIRLRNTDGFCEIMLKQKIGDAREEISLALQDSDLTQAIKVVKALGCTSGIWMHRIKDIYRFEDIEWSLVICPNNIRYFEAEIEVSDESHIAEAKEKIRTVAERMGLTLLDDDGTRALIERLGREANK